MQEAPRDRAARERQEEQEWIRKREKDMHLPRKEGAIITVRLRTEIVREETSVTETAREEMEIIRIVREGISVTETARAEDQERIIKTVREETSATETVREETKETEETETARDGIREIKETETARDGDKETEETTDRPSRRQW